MLTGILIFKWLQYWGAYYKLRLIIYFFKNTIINSVWFVLILLKYYTNEISCINQLTVHVPIILIPSLHITYASPSGRITHMCCIRLTIVQYGKLVFSSSKFLTLCSKQRFSYVRENWPIIINLKIWILVLFFRHFYKL